MGSNLYLKACETPWRGRARARAGNIINIRDCGARGHREGIREAADLSDETSKTDLVERQLRASVYQGSGSRPIKTTQRRRGRLLTHTHTHSACSLVTLNHIPACPLFTPGFFFSSKDRRSKPLSRAGDEGERNITRGSIPADACRSPPGLITPRQLSAK